MNTDNLYIKALNQEFLSVDEGLFLYENSPTADLMFIGNEIRKLNQAEKNRDKVGWIIDRNVNITNVCIAQCEFCNFYRKPNAPDTYITSLEEYDEKIKVLKKLGGNQLLMQGGLHPKLGLEYYKKLFSDLKEMHPDIKLHALGPAEIHHIARLAKTTYKDVLVQLTEAGLDSLPGAGAEILNDRVRKIVSRGKCTAQQWLDVMSEAHKLKITTSATMMFGHIETHRERIEHFVKLREVQDEKPDDSEGFTTFIPWPFQDEGTELNKKSGIQNDVTADEYIRTIALSRIMMPNIKNVQASWLTVGKSTGQMSLHAGANDFGSIMIEENVVSVAGADHSFNAEQIQEAIKEAGFIPAFRNQRYEYIGN
ncbi:MAG: dehypoxanthine futalosine cyclase [Bacteroidales bacterium]|nr:dehypoxanthine futalosine cyclase [Bacteroidales bacterium]